MSGASWWKALGGRYAISWVSAVLSALMVVSSTVWDVRHWPIDAGVMLTAQLIGLAALLSVLGIARLTWLRPGSATSERPWVALGTFVAAALARLAGLAAVLLIAGEWGNWPVEQSLIFGVLGQVVLLSLVSITVNVVRANSDSIVRLEVARQTLARARALSEEDIAQRERAFVDGVLQQVQQTLSSVLTSGDPQVVVQAVRSAALEVVRPASHRLHAGDVATHHAIAPAPRIRIGQVLANVRPTAPVAGPITYELLVLGTVWGVFGAPIALTSLVLGSLLLVGTNLVLRSIWRRTPPRRAHLVWLLVGYVVGNVIALAVVSIPVTLLGSNAGSLWVGIGIYPGLMALICIVSSLAQQQSTLMRDLDLALEEESRALADISDTAAEQRQHLARLMHGGVQSDLIAAATRMESARGPHSRDLSSDLAALANKLRDRYAGLDDPKKDQRLEELVETWQMVTDVELNVDSLAAQALDSDIRLRSQAVAIVSEALTNAVRHGSGGTISVDVEEGSASLSITVAHDGELQSGGTGLGLGEIDRMAESWELAQQGERVVLHAEVGRQG